MESRHIITRREFSRLALLGGLASMLPACKSGGGSSKPKNKPPSISVFPTFKNNGTVDYTVIGKDTDGQVVQMSTQYNDENRELYQGDNIAVTKPINKQSNTLEVIATDNAGGTSTFLHTLKVPTREKAFAQIKQILDSRGGFLFYESDPAKKVSFNLNDAEYFFDFLITRADGRSSVINYVTFNENLEAEKLNQSACNLYFIDNLYLYKLPADEITKKMDEFIKVGYLTDF